MPIIIEDGTLVFDSFRVQRMLDSGGQSICYLARDMSPADPRDAKVVIKQYTDLVPGGSEASNLERHFTALRERMQARSGYLCLPIYLGESHQSIIAVFPFVEGKSLKDLLQDGLDEDARIRIALALSNTIRDLASRGIAHLDLKPDNIMIETGHDGNAYVRLIDLDASQIDGEGLRERPMGTEDYMSPEHIKPEKYGPLSPKADVFALGIVLYELLLCEQPFETRTYLDAVECGAFQVPDNKLHYLVVEKIIECLRPNPRLRPDARYVHSCLHSNSATRLKATRADEEWRAPYFTIKRVCFERTYFNGLHLGKANLRGSDLLGLPESFLILRPDIRGVELELTDASVNVRINRETLHVGGRRLVQQDALIYINHIAFEFLLRCFD